MCLDGLDPAHAAEAQPLAGAATPAAPAASDPLTARAAAPSRSGPAPRGELETPPGDAWDEHVIPKPGDEYGGGTRSAWTTGNKTVLYIRATFADSPTADP